MKVLGPLKGVWDLLFRFRRPDTEPLHERVLAEQESLADLRHTPGFSLLLDIFDGELRALFHKWCDIDSNDLDGLRSTHAEAMALKRLVNTMERSVSGVDRAKQAEEEINRQFELMKTDRNRRSEAMERSRAARQRMMSASA
jgi:hypothetical protein